MIKEGFEAMGVFLEVKEEGDKKEEISLSPPVTVTPIHCALRNEGSGSGIKDASHSAFS